MLLLLLNLLIATEGTLKDWNTITDPALNVPYTSTQILKIRYSYTPHDNDNKYFKLYFLDGMMAESGPLEWNVVDAQLLYEDLPPKEGVAFPEEDVTKNVMLVTVLFQKRVLDRTIEQSGYTVGEVPDTVGEESDTVLVVYFTTSWEEKSFTWTLNTEQAQRVGRMTAVRFHLLYQEPHNGQYIVLEPTHDCAPLPGTTPGPTQPVDVSRKRWDSADTDDNVSKRESGSADTDNNVTRRMSDSADSDTDDYVSKRRSGSAVTDDNVCSTWFNLLKKQNKVKFSVEQSLLVQYTRTVVTTDWSSVVVMAKGEARYSFSWVGKDDVAWTDYVQQPRQDSKHPQEFIISGGLLTWSFRIDRSGERLYATSSNEDAGTKSWVFDIMEGASIGEASINDLNGYGNPRYRNEDNWQNKGWNTIQPLINYDYSYLYTLKLSFTDSAVVVYFTTGDTDFKYEGELKLNDEGGIVRYDTFEPGSTTQQCPGTVLLWAIEVVDDELLQLAKLVVHCTTASDQFKLTWTLDNQQTRAIKAVTKVTFATHAAKQGQFLAYPAEPGWTSILSKEQSAGFAVTDKLLVTYHHPKKLVKWLRVWLWNSNSADVITPVAKIYWKGANEVSVAIGQAGSRYTKVFTQGDEELHWAFQLTKDGKLRVDCTGGTTETWSAPCIGCTVERVELKGFQLYGASYKVHRTPLVTGHHGQRAQNRRKIHNLQNRLRKNWKLKQSLLPVPSIPAPAPGPSPPAPGHLLPTPELALPPLLRHPGPVEDMNLLMVVDSNLMSVTIGKKCEKLRPYIRCAGEVVTVFTVWNQEKPLPTLTQIKEKGYTDIVVNLGTNHIKLDAKNYTAAAKILISYYVRIREEMPGVRCYYLKTPPAVSERLSKNAEQFNTLVIGGVADYEVTVIDIPQQMISSNGCLKAQYDNDSNKPLQKRLHYTKEGKSLVMLMVKMAVQKSANKVLK